MAKKRSKKKPQKEKKTKQINKKGEKNNIRFVETYLANGRNGTKAYLAIKPDVTENTARTEASKLLAKPNVQAYLTQREKELLADLNITAQRVLQEAARLAFVDVRKLFDDKGQLKKPQDLDDDTAAALAAIDIEELFEGRGEDREHVGYMHKFKVFDKGQAVERLMKYLKLYLEPAQPPTPPTPVNVKVDVHLTPDEAYKRMLDGPSKR